MSDTETRLRELLHDPSTWSDTGQGTYVDRITGARRYAARARWARLAAVAAVVAAVIGLGGVVASGAFRDRTLPPANPLPTSAAPNLPAGPAWKDNVQLTDAQGRKVTVSIAAVITKAGTSAPDPQDRTKRLFTAPSMGGYYTLTNHAAAARDVTAPVQFMAYWKVPAGFCARYNTFIALGGWPVPKVANGQEMCPLAAGDSTLPGTPQTLTPRQPLLVRIQGVTLGVAQDAPLALSPADAAIAVRVSATPPAGWLAFDEDFPTGNDSRIASTGMPTP
jgi:hypothetical protein